MAALMLGAALLTPGPIASALPTETSTAPQGLESYYSQEVSWYPCTSKGMDPAAAASQFSCAKVRVPMDYSQPEGKAIQIAVKKRAAEGESRGSLFINPGGPGGSGIDLVETVQGQFSQELLAGYDIVGFDPRGVGASTPITCGDAEVPQDLTSNPAPGQSFEDWAHGYVEKLSALRQACEHNSEPGLLDNVNTVSVARDLDILRAVSGQGSLNYLGFSYGSEIGYTYADLFPHNTGHMVLDGIVDSAISNAEFSLGQQEGHEKALRSYVQACLAGQAGDGCPLSGSVEDGIQQIRNLIDTLNASPFTIPSPDPSRFPDIKITGDVMRQLISADLRSGQWQSLTMLLSGVMNRQESSSSVEDALKVALEEQRKETAKESTPAEALAANTAVWCQDRPSLGNVESWKADYEKSKELAPTMSVAATLDMNCAAWGHYSTTSPLPQDVHATGAAPILVVGTTGDPATPYAWAEAIASRLDSGRLVTWQGKGHCAYGKGSSCLSSAVDGFLLHGKVPEDNLTCPTR